MDWKTVGSKILKELPLIGTVLGGPVVGGAVSVLASALGCAAEPDAVMRAIQTDPMAAEKLKEAEMANKIELQKLVLQQDQMYILDVQNARQRQIEVTKATGKTDVNLYTLAWLVVGCFFLLVAVLMFVTLPETNIGPINQLFGAMAAGFGMVLAYFFGSSKSSAEKTQLLANGNKSV